MQSALWGYFLGYDGDVMTPTLFVKLPPQLPALSYVTFSYQNTASCKLTTIFLIAAIRAVSYAITKSGRDDA